MIYERQCRASGEGANIRTWVGFKHFEYVVAEAVHDYLAGLGLDLRTLIIDGGGVEIVTSRVALTSVIELGDPLSVRFLDATRTAPDAILLRVEIENLRSGHISLRGRYLIRVWAFPDEAGPLPSILAGTAVGPVPTAARPRPGSLGVGGVGGVGGIVAEDALPEAYAYEWIIPYYYCERSQALSYRGYVRAIETVVDEYLRSVGLPIPDLLADRAWIPVVSKYSVEVLAPARMGATVRTFFRVDGIVGQLVFDGSWATYCQDPDGWVCTARGEIQHGYAISRGQGAGSVATLDPATVKALTAGEDR